MDPKEFVSQNAGRVIQTQSGFWAFVPNSLPPEITWTEALVSVLAEAERDLGKPG